MEINKNVMGSNVNENSNSAKTKSQLSVDDFLKIMAAEIQNQNPFGGDSGGGGGSKTDYISQLAQFTTLEELSTISESIGLMTVMNQQQYAFNLIGKEVTVMGDEEIRAVVDKVKFQNGFAIIEVQGEDYHLSQVSEIQNAGGSDEF